MKCPHCLVEFHDDPRFGLMGEDIEGFWSYRKMICPSCKKMIIWLTCGKNPIKWGLNVGSEYTDFSCDTIIKNWLAHPKGYVRPPCPPEVPITIANDYIEACLVLYDSPKASAALSRRCLQNLLREKGGITQSDLSNEIQQVIDGGTLPRYLRDDIDAVRAIGNFAAHPNKSLTTGLIVDVEPGEGDWLLNVLEGLFDFYYVQPAIAQKKRDSLNQKLQDIGKPAIK